MGYIRYYYEHSLKLIWEKKKLKRKTFIDFRVTEDALEIGAMVEGAGHDGIGDFILASLKIYRQLKASDPEQKKAFRPADGHRPSYSSPWAEGMKVVNPVEPGAMKVVPVDVSLDGVI